MTENKDLAARLIELESHLAHHERMINELSDVITQQWKTINGLTRKLDRLESRLQAAQDQETPPAEEPPPPHY